MPLDGIPWWANALGGLISGGVIAKLIDATRERGKTLSGERISLREFEERDNIFPAVDYRVYR